MADFTLKRNDTKPYFRASLTSNAAAYDVTGATIKFIMKVDGAASPKVDSAATIIDATGGIIEYQWLATDTDTEGLYNAEVEVTDSGGKVLTFPNGADGTNYWTVEITQDLG